MCDILIFGGTAEGRILAEFCTEHKIFSYISVATDYGQNVLEKSRYLNIIQGRMNDVEIAEFILNNGIKTVVDATHPYAAEVTKNIKSACAFTGASYLRVQRESNEYAEKSRYFESTDSLVNYLDSTEGNIFLTTGSKELWKFCRIHNYKERCTARVLPSENIVKECVNIGFDESKIIAEKPPFSYEQNLAQMKSCNAKYLVTKESGTIGGFEDKLKAAHEINAEVLIIRRPQDCGSTLEEAKEMLLEEKHRQKKVTVAGVGMDGSKTMTAEGLKALQQAEVLIGAKRIITMFEYLNKPSFVSYACDKIANYIYECEYRNIVVLMSGDIGFYSGAKKLLPMIDGLETNVVCGISSPVYFCSKLKMDWSNVHFVSLHGKKANVVRTVCRFEKTFFLLGGDITVRDICRLLCEYGMNDVNVFVGENLSLENERIISGTAADMIDLKTDNLCVMIAENHGYERSIKSSICDDEFIRGKIPMTKSEVRGVCVSKLGIGESDICWDIGCGTGSVSVEMALRCCEGTVYAVDRNPDAAAFTDKNKHLFRCDNIEIISENAVDAVEKLPAPDCVFVGGSGGYLNKIINAAFEKNPKVKIIVTAVSLETLGECTRIIDTLEKNINVTQIAVTRTHKVGNHTMMKAENPIFIIEIN